MTDYLVATVKPWNIDAFRRYAPAVPGDWHLVTDPEQLEAEAERLAPRYIFFPHWSWRVPESLLNKHECVCFHMSDVPYGRGGSPLQNLIERGHRETVLTALRMVNELDAGPVYGKRPLNLAGRAQTVYERAAELSWELIGWLVREEPQPQPQTGEAVMFPRRTPEQSRLPETDDLEKLYDHIRMLDAATYPRAFIEYGPWRIEFSHAGKQDNALVGQFCITRQTDDD